MADDTDTNKTPATTTQTPAAAPTKMDATPTQDTSEKITVPSDPEEAQANLEDVSSSDDLENFAGDTMGQRIGTFIQHIEKTVEQFEAGAKLWCSKELANIIAGYHHFTGTWSAPNEDGVAQVGTIQINGKAVTIHAGDESDGVYIEDNSNPLADARAKDSAGNAKT